MCPPRTLVCRRAAPNGWEQRLFSVASHLGLRPGAQRGVSMSPLVGPQTSLLQADRQAPAEPNVTPSKNTSSARRLPISASIGSDEFASPG